MKVQIDQDLWLNLWRFFMLEQQDDRTYAACADGIAKKWQSQYRRFLYSRYKNRDIPPEEREAARQAYIRETGIPEDFIWPEGWDGSQ